MLSISVILSGMLTDFRAVQPKNRLVSTLLSFEGRVMLSRLVQL